MDLLHLYLRTTERMLNDLFDCYTPEARTKLIARLKENGVKDAEFKKKRAESKKLRISLSGEQCDSLLKKWKAVVVPEAGRTPKNLLDLWQRFDDAWILLYSKDPAVDAKQQIAAIHSLKKEIRKTIRTESLMSNSMHVLIDHVPQYLPKFEESGGLARFAQEGTERRVKESKDVLHRLTQHGQKGNRNVIQHQNVLLKRKAEAAAAGTLKPFKERKKRTRRS